MYTVGDVSSTEKANHIPRLSTLDRAFEAVPGLIQGPLVTVIPIWRDEMRAVGRLDIGCWAYR